MTPEEKAVIDAAIVERNGLARLLDRGPLATAVDALIESRKPAEEWVPAPLHFVLANDRIRVNGQETKVLRSSAGVWYVNTADYWHPSPWQHTELRLDLEANPGFQEYPPNLECEILMTTERQAVYLLQQGFPGTTVVSSD